MLFATLRFQTIGWLVISAIVVASPITSFSDSLIEFTASERTMIVAHGPWPPLFTTDPSNRVSGSPAAIALGARLFSDARLSKYNRFSCETCHQFNRSFTDGQIVNTRHHRLVRNTPTVVNLRWNRWFGWDGSADSLWAQSIRPIVSDREMQASPKHVVTLISEDALLSCGFQQAFGIMPSEMGAEDVLVLVAKALAAYQETLVSGRSAFDEFRDALIAGDFKSARAYPLAAQRGLKLFVGRGKCSLCHFGPNFANGEFADVGIPFFISKGVVDKGRFGGIQNLKKNHYNLLGRFNDNSSRSTAISTRHVVKQHRNWGEFKIPGLRNVAMTAPYMHNGSLPTLESVVRHYSEINEDRLHSDGEKILQPLNLSPKEMGDLVAFLKSLTAPVKVSDGLNDSINSECD